MKPPHHNETVNFNGLGAVDVGVIGVLIRKAKKAVNFTQDSFSVRDGSKIRDGEKTVQESGAVFMCTHTNTHAHTKKTKELWT